MSILLFNSFAGKGATNYTKRYGALLRNRKPLTERMRYHRRVVVDTSEPYPDNQVYQCLVMYLGDWPTFEWIDPWYVLLGAPLDYE